jgi:hypothetical protein
MLSGDFISTITMVCIRYMEDVRLQVCLSVTLRVQTLTKQFY